MGSSHYFILFIPSQWYDRMGWTHWIKCISNGFTWDIDHPLCPNGMLGWVIVQWLLYGTRITCPNLLMVQWDIEYPIGHLLAVIDMPPYLLSH